jgi:phospholipid transport system transporter-binding protein
MISCNGDRCALDGPVTLENATAMLEEGIRQFTSPHVTVDLSAVTEVDSTALSLLLEWRRAARRANRKIQFISLPDNLQSLAKLYGVSELLAEAE